MDDEIGEALSRALAAETKLANILALCDAADEADLKPAPMGSEPIEVRWTVAVRAAAGLPVSS